MITLANIENAISKANDLITKKNLSPEKLESMSKNMDMDFVEYAKFQELKSGLMGTILSLEAAQFVYNKIGILKNPSSLTKIDTSINDPGGNKSTYMWTNNTFNQLLSANISPAVTYTVGDTITGANSGSIGTIAFANDSVIYMTGQKRFLPSEGIKNQNGISTIMTINKDIANTYITGDIYTKDIQPLYVQNLDDVKRSNSQTENYKLIIQV